MKKNNFRKLLRLLTLSAVLAIMLTGCGGTNTSPSENTSTASMAVASDSPSSGANSDAAEEDRTDTSSEDSRDTFSEDIVPVTQLYVTFGDNGASFTMHLYDNDTAAAIARHVGTAGWRLPIYNYDGYDNWEVMQYYDIPSHYEIPSKPQSVTSENSGTVYYSEPNRIVLFFGDAQVFGEYTPVGYFDATDDFVSAVQNNPVLEGWGNKIVQISADKNQSL